MTDQIKIMIEGLADFLDVVKNGKDITTEQFATNLLSKLNKLDRKKVERKVNYWMAHYSPDVDWLIEGIMSLVPEQPKMNEQSIREILISNGCYALDKYCYNKDKIIKELSKLSICKTGGEE